MPITFHSISAEVVERVLELVQLDRRGAARAVIAELDFLAEEAELEGVAEIAAAAREGATAARRWAEGGDDLTGARIGVVRAAASLSRLVRGAS